MVKTVTAMNIELSFEFPSSQGEKGKMEIGYLTYPIIHYITL